MRIQTSAIGLNLFKRNKYYEEAVEYAKNETNTFWVENFAVDENPIFSADGRQVFSDSFVYKVTPYALNDCLFL